MIEALDGSQLARAIATEPCLLVWFDGTPDGFGHACSRFVPTMQRFAQHLSGKARVVLVDVDLWYDTALEQSGGGAPDLVLFKHGKQVARHSGMATLSELLLWVSPHVTPCSLPTLSLLRVDVD
jgi:thioredoxin-like negative regulator of GroEL